MKEINLDALPAADKEKLATLNIDDIIMLQGVKYKVEQLFSNGRQRAAKLVPV
jgi:hypothetical protein